MQKRNEMKTTLPLKNRLWLCTAVTLVVGVAIAATWGTLARKVSNLSISFDSKLASVVHPVSLQVAFRDQEVVDGKQGALHAGTATYTFKNNMPIPIKFVFPPLGYTSGGSLPITPSSNDIDSMPQFCRAEQMIELAPNAQRSFTTNYHIACASGAAPPTEQFVFGPTSEHEKGVLIDAVESVSIWNKDDDHSTKEKE